MSPALQGGASIALARLRTRAFSISLGLAVSLTLVAALVEKNASPYGAVDRALSVVFSWVIPLLSLAVFSRTLGRQSLRDAAWPVARFGASRAKVSLGIALTSIGACALLAALLAATTVVLAHTNSAPSLSTDLFTSAWIAGLVGAAYGAWLSLGATFGRNGGGRLLFVLLDFVLGRTDTFGLVFPRGNAANLLGFEGPFDVSQRVSSTLLIGLSALVVAIAMWRSRD